MVSRRLSREPVLYLSFRYNAVMYVVDLWLHFEHLYG